MENYFLPDEIQIDRMMLESFGITVSDKLEAVINESTIRSSDEKLYGVDMIFVFHLNDVVEDIVDRNEAFGLYLDSEIYSKADSCIASILIDEGIDEIIRQKLTVFIDGLDKGEVLRYDEFFRSLFDDEFIRFTFGEELSDDIVRGIRGDDGRFELMPHTVRIL